MNLSTGTDRSRSDHVRNRFLTPREIARQFNKFVIGQPRATKTLAVAVSDHSRRPIDVKKSNVLIVGPTGCGKTELSRIAARIMGVPFAEAKMAGKVRSGYTGDPLETVFEDLISQNSERSRHGVVFLDEIDKIADTHFDTFYGAELQKQLIGWVESAVVRFRVPVSEPDSPHDFVYHTFDTTNVLFIAAGVFDGLERIIANRLSGHNGGKVAPERLAELYDRIIPEDLVTFGFKRELVGRFPVITYVRPLSAEDLVTIMKTSESSVVLGQLKLLQDGYNVRVELNEEVYLLLAKAALRLGEGARGLETVCYKLFEDIKFNIENRAKRRTCLVVNEIDARRHLGELISHP